MCIRDRERRWTNDNAYRMTKIFYPKPDSNKAKKILKLNRGQLKKLIELITGQNNLNYMNNKVYGSEDLCRFCEEEEETFDHIINDCPCFYLDRCDLLQNQPIINTLEWDPEILLKFANIDTIKDALSFHPRTENIW